MSGLGGHDQGQGADAHGGHPSRPDRRRSILLGPGHAPEALEDSEYVGFSPTEQFGPVIEHITSGAGSSA